MKWITYKDHPRVEVDSISDFKKSSIIEVALVVKGRVIDYDCEHVIKFFDYSNQIFEVWELDSQDELDKVYNAVEKKLQEVGINSEIVP